MAFLSVRVDEKERLAIDREANRLGLSTSAFLRMLWRSWLSRGIFRDDVP